VESDNTIGDQHSPPLEDAGFRRGFGLRLGRARRIETELSSGGDHPSVIGDKVTEVTTELLGAGEVLSLIHI